MVFYSRSTQIVPQLRSNSKAPTRPRTGNALVLALPMSTQAATTTQNASSASFVVFTDRPSMTLDAHVALTTVAAELLGQPTLHLFRRGGVQSRPAT
eukprot:CAMPEP_0195606274 /NCGR_PEP_ID=MMETSP0815-20121206/7598_1 /TAXON_ID=97485 /ORGANISM="Prymnesium parvum, Strain Texoma1" /LENGTH=96 /DNA_ID=CAMNT_0040746005 /DNA_START=779 /DNA_END=1065 /DNA_ORIENTATION=+